MPDLDDIAIKETYLGDGAYASYDGFSIWLRAPREHGDHFVALEPQVFESFLQFAQQCGAWRKS
jgi:hypothetical protein